MLQIDNSAVRQKQVDQLNELKSKRNNDEVLAALSALEESAKLEGSTSKGDNPNNLMALCINAARVRCTLGEMSLALEKAWGRHVPSSTIVQGAYGASFTSNSEKNESEYNHVLDLVKKFEQNEGRRPRILVAKMVSFSRPGSQTLHFIVFTVYPTSFFRLPCKGPGWPRSRCEGHCLRFQRPGIRR